MCAKYVFSPVCVCVFNMVLPPVFPQCVFNMVFPPVFPQCVFNMVFPQCVFVCAWLGRWAGKIFFHTLGNNMVFPQCVFACA